MKYSLWWLLLCSGPCFSCPFGCDALEVNDDNKEKIASYVVFTSRDQTLLYMGYKDNLVEVLPGKNLPGSKRIVKKIESSGVTFTDGSRYELNNK